MPIGRPSRIVYYEHISNPLVTLPDRLPDAQNVYYLFPILCFRRDELQAYLKENGIEKLIHYPILLTSKNAIRNMLI